AASARSDSALAVFQGFYEATWNLGLQPSSKIDRVETRSPPWRYLHILAAGVRVRLLPLPLLPLQPAADDLQEPLRLLHVRDVGTVLQHLPLRALDALVDGARHQRRRLVVPPRDDQRRLVDLPSRVVTSHSRSEPVQENSLGPHIV